MIPIGKHLHRLWLKAVIAATWLIYYPFYYYLLKAGRYTPASRLRKLQARQVLLLGGFRLSIQGTSLLNVKQKIYCANHTSFLDIFILLAVAPEPVFFIGKAELLASPITRLFFTTIDVPVNREDKRSAINAVINATARLKQGLSLVIFPEGGYRTSIPAPATTL